MVQACSFERSPLDSQVKLSHIMRKRRQGEIAPDASIGETMSKTIAYRTNDMLRRFNISHVDEVLRGLEDTSNLNVLPLELFGLVLIVKKNTFASLFVCHKRVPPVTCLDYLTDEDLRFLLVFLTSRCGLGLRAKNRVEL